jgi:hypothetical protein
MSERASIQLTRSKRAPPVRAKPPTQLPTIDVSADKAIEEIARAIAELQRLDEDMLTIDTAIDTHEQIWVDPTTDPWDRVDTEQALDRLYDQRSQASWNVMQSANRLIFFGTVLVDEWRDVALDNAARKMSCCDGLFQRVSAEWPEIAKDGIWQRFQGEAVPF